ncbi:MAG: acyl-[ACP]--phospholipid O-acyltransferase [Candidatus Omnitrophica bacterium]|nr:acyl-[ACP]--phospholipid O-acyltransferase [Candidatus Omnitrophota bacterium]
MEERKKGFLALVVTQFLGAFNDNAFKLVISFLAINVLMGQEKGTEYVSLAGIVFILPFLMFSTFAGYLADKYSKQKIVIYTKIMELVIMILGYFAIVSQNTLGIYTVLFLMGAQSAFFSPAKFGMMPELLTEEEISEGNGAMQMWSYIAIIIGTAFGGYIFFQLKDVAYKTTYIFMGIAVLGIISSLFVTKGKPASSQRKMELNIIKELISNMKHIRLDRGVFLSIVGLTYFGLFGGLFQLNILLYASKIMQVNEMHTGILLTVTGLGMGIGSFMAGKLSEHKVEYGLVPLGGLGLSLTSILLGFTYGSFLFTNIVLFFLGVSCGFFIVPLNALIQIRTPEDRRGQALATMNFFSFGAILFASGLLYICREWININSAQIFLCTGIFSIGITLYVFKVMPEAFVRLINWILAHTLYKVKVVGENNIPKEGGALLVCNHVSYADPILVLSSVKRPIRFLVFKPIYNNPIIKPFCKALNAIPVSFLDGPKAILKSLQIAKEAIQNGELVCIFAEGGLTRTGNMLPFNKGFEYIMNDLNAPIIPMNLDRIWGSVFSYKDGKYFKKLPQYIPYPITISFAEGMPADSKVHEVRTKIQELSADAMNYREGFHKKLHMILINQVKKHPFRFCMADSMGLKFNYLKLLASVITFSNKMFPEKVFKSEKQEMVGVMLPASCIGSIVNLSTWFAGKIPVNLNFTASKDSIDYAMEQCEMKRIVTSRKFLQKMNLQEDPKMIFLEDIKKKISKVQFFKNMLLSFILPGFLIKILMVKGDRKNVDDTATVIFSSGSTGTPKGVMLSHKNILSDLGGVYQILNINKSEVIMGTLPLFHSFGFTCTMGLPLGVGMGVVYHSNPVDYKTIGNMVQQYKASIIMGTPTFLSTYTRKCTREQFSTLRFAIIGAEKLKKKIAEDFYAKFGVTPLEGYGATELSPVVSMCIPDYISPNQQVKQIGYKEGKVGHPLPNIAVKVVDPDTFEMLPANETGMLLVKGANVMKGYLNQPRKTEEVIRDGWYITGDIATIDDDGFICITDRLSRFSKIGGEMVPNVKVEEMINELAGAEEQVVVVTSVADDKKGEKLIVLYKKNLKVEEIISKLNRTELPNLWIPKKENFFQIDNIPYLGTGKLDLKAIKTLAQELASSV